MPGRDSMGAAPSRHTVPSGDRAAAPGPAAKDARDGSRYLVRALVSIEPGVDGRLADGRRLMCAFLRETARPTHVAGRLKARTIACPSASSRLPTRGHALRRLS
jgi:hypothetical protein